ncbi:MAG: YciI family protein [Rhodospirillaceae bacterium]
MLYVCYGVDGPDGPALREQARADHFKYLESNADILVLGGATLEDCSDARTGSLLVINVPDRAAADVFAENEPLRKAGVFQTYTISRMRRGQWYPNNAPKSAEGD